MVASAEDGESQERVRSCRVTRDTNFLLPLMQTQCKSARPDQYTKR